MKPLFSEEYYRTYWDRFLVPVPGNDYINLEGDLQKIMDAYRRAGISAGISEEAFRIIEHHEAKKLKAKCEQLVWVEKGILESILAGKSCFGMTTQRQEIEKQAEFRKRFEFNCLQLSDFKKNHNL